MPGRDDEGEDSGENDPAKSTPCWLLNAIKPAAPQPRAWRPDYPARGHSEAAPARWKNLDREMGGVPSPSKKSPRLPRGPAPDRLR